MYTIFNFTCFSACNFKVKEKWKWHTAKYGDPYSEYVRYIYPTKCTHTQQWTHTWTHTQSSGQPFMLRHPGSNWGLVQGHIVVVLMVERALYIHSPHLQSLPDRDSNSQPFHYESNSLPLGHNFPRLTAMWAETINKHALKCPLPYWKIHGKMKKQPKTD